MTDYILIYTGPQDLQIGIGKGHVAGVILTSDDTIPGACTLYDYAGGGPPDDEIYQVVVNNQYPITHLFNDRYAPRFAEGLWLHLSDHCYVMIYAHIPPP